jgi:hypothetical protein
MPQAVTGLKLGVERRRVAMTAKKGMCSAPVHGLNDADAPGELVHVVGSVPCGKHVLG